MVVSEIVDTAGDRWTGKSAGRAAVASAGGEKVEAGKSARGFGRERPGVSEREKEKEKGTQQLSSRRPQRSRHLFSTVSSAIHGVPFLNVPALYPRLVFVCRPSACRHRKAHLPALSWSPGSDLLF